MDHMKAFTPDDGLKDGRTGCKPTSRRVEAHEGVMTSFSHLATEFLNLRWRGAISFVLLRFGVSWGSSVEVWILRLGRR